MVDITAKFGVGIDVYKRQAEKNERELNVSSSVLSMLDEVAANAQDVGEQLPMVGGASEVIRSYLNLSDYRSDTLPDNLMDLNTIFDRVLLAPYLSLIHI